MFRYLILSEKSWHKELFSNLEVFFSNDKWFMIDSKKDFNLDNLKKLIQPKFLFHIGHILYQRKYLINMNVLFFI